MRKLLLSLALLLALPAFVLASPGGLDKFGGHVDHKTNTYHFHKLNGRKLAEPLDGEDPNKNGGKIVYTGTPKYADEAAADKKEAKAEKKTAPAAAPAAAAPAAAVSAPSADAKPAKVKKAKKSKAAKVEAPAAAPAAAVTGAAPAAPAADAPKTKAEKKAEKKAAKAKKAEEAKEKTPEAAAATDKK